MDFEQILIRLGLDAKAVTAGLTRTTSFVKSWAIGLMHDLQHHVIGRFAGLYVFDRVFESIKEKSQFILRTAKETGLSTNMVQGMANELDNVGEGFEGMQKPLGKFNELIGKAKMGSIEARTKLIDLGIITKAEEVNSLDLSKGLRAAANEMEHISDASKRAAKMEEMFGKSWEAMLPVLDLGAKKLADMDKSNFFTKLTPATLQTFSDVVRGGKGAWNSAVSTVGNVFGSIAGPFIRQGKLREMMKEKGSTGLGPMEELKYIFTGVVDKESELNSKAQETNEVFMQRLHIQEMINDARKLENSMEDRTKSTVEQLANKGFKLLGRKAPEALENVHAITPGIASAMQIKTLEVAAQDANARGQFGRATDLQSRADKLRESNMSLKSTERDPTREARERFEELKSILQRTGVKVDEIMHTNR